MSPNEVDDRANNDFARDQGSDDLGQRIADEPNAETLPSEDLRADESGPASMDFGEVARSLALILLIGAAALGVRHWLRTQGSHQANERLRTEEKRAASMLGSRYLAELRVHWGDRQDFDIAVAIARSEHSSSWEMAQNVQPLDLSFLSERSATADDVMPLFPIYAEIQTKTIQTRLEDLQPSDAPVSTSTVLGEWTHASPRGLVTWSLTVDGRYARTLQDDSAVDGAWSVQGAAIVLSADVGTGDEDTGPRRYELRRWDAHTLIVQSPEDQLEIWKRAVRRPAES